MICEICVSPLAVDSRRRGLPRNRRSVRPAIIGDHRRKSTVPKGRPHRAWDAPSAPVGFLRRGTGESHHLHHLQEESPRRPDKDCQYKRGSDEEFATSMLGPAQGALACSHASSYTVSVIQRLQPLLSEVTLSIGFESGDRRLSSRGAAQRDYELTSTRLGRSSLSRPRRDADSSRGGKGLLPPARDAGREADGPR